MGCEIGILVGRTHQLTLNAQPAIDTQDKTTIPEVWPMRVMSHGL